MPGNPLPLPEVCGQCICLKTRGVLNQDITLVWMQSYGDVEILSLKKGTEVYVFPGLSRIGVKINDEIVEVLGLNYRLQEMSNVNLELYYEKQDWILRKFPGRTIPLPDGSVTLVVRQTPND